MNEERLAALLLAWQEHQSLGRDVSAAELCQDCRELAADLRKRIHILQHMNSLLRLSNTGVATPQAASDAETGNWQTGPGKDSMAETRPQTAETRPAAAFLPGSVPGYEILGELGRGGMGVVYKARQQNLNRIVALKMILAGNHESPDARVRFLHEAETIARLKHPNVVQVYDFGTQEGKPYFSLEYLEGGSLASKLHGEPEKPVQAARLVETLARAVQAAHAQGIVHRDLKPANILIDCPLPIADCRLPREESGEVSSALGTRHSALQRSPTLVWPSKAIPG
jgi:tRNA A-37 threonylcarbamoyl transferase component Bud32